MPRKQNTLSKDHMIVVETVDYTDPNAHLKSLPTSPGTVRMVFITNRASATVSKVQKLMPGCSVQVIPVDDIDLVEQAISAAKASAKEFDAQFAGRGKRGTASEAVTSNE